MVLVSAIAPPSFRRPTKDADPDGLLFQTQESVRDAIVPLCASPLAQVAIVGPVTFAAGAEQVLVHGLGAQPTGWKCIDATGAAFTGYRVAWDEHTIRIHPTSTGAATLLVF